MFNLRRSSILVAPAISLLLGSACGGESGDTTAGTTTTTPPAGTTTTVGSTSGEPLTTGDETTDNPTSTPGSDPTQDPTNAATSTPTSVPSTGPDPDTGIGTAPDTDTGSNTGTDTGDDTTGGIDPNALPQIPDDGMPSNAHQKEVPLGSSDALQGYFEYLPPGYGGGEKYPLMVFLHGIGENGNGVEELTKVANNGPPALIKNDQWAKDRPFVVLSPQHKNDGGCPGAAEIHDFIAFATTHYDINPNRVYLTGLSCGAIGAWGYLGNYLDEQIVALVPIAGDGNGAFGQAGCELGRVPIWAFHGDADGTVLPSGTINPITSLQACDPKPDAEMVIYPGVGHDSWTQTYNLSAGHDIYAWLLGHVKTP